MGRGGVGGDVTEGRAVAEAVRRSRETVMALLDASPDSTLLLDPDFVILACNRVMAARFGKSFVDLIGRSLLDLLPPEIAEERREKMEEALRNGRIVRFRDERAGFVSDNTLVPVLDASGRVKQLAVFGRDVTALVRTEEERERLEAQLRQSQKMEAIGRLAGGVAHDFNNLLTVIQGYGEMLAASLDDDERREQVGEVLKAADRAATLTRQLLAFSRRQALEMRLFDLGATVGETEKMLRRVIGEDIELDVATPAKPALVKGDPGQIEQVLLNLAVNARDAMLRGGRLSIVVAGEDLDAPLAMANFVVPRGRYVVLSVRDTGSGMDAETLSHLFEPIFTTKEKGKGTGLGLATVYGIVKQSGGFVTVASAPGAGTTFRIFLPRSGEEGAAEEPKPSGNGIGGSETILLVEDESAVRDLARRFLEGRGYRFLAAGSGAEALALLDRHEGPVHLLVTDLVMPGMNGRLLARKVATRRPGMRVLYISGYFSGLFHRQDPGRRASASCRSRSARRTWRAPSARPW